MVWWWKRNGEKTRRMNRVLGPTGDGAGASSAPQAGPEDRPPFSDRSRPDTAKARAAQRYFRPDSSLEAKTTRARGSNSGAYRCPRASKVTYQEKKKSGDSLMRGRPVQKVAAEAK